VTALIAQLLSPANWVTLARAGLAAAVAAVVAASFGRPVPAALVVSLAALALALDAVDGWVARRTRTTALGARLDGEVDAFLILALSVYVSRSVGAWVLAIGLARYAFLVAGWLLPWMREPLPPRHWRKVVAATQGVVLTIAAADVLPRAVTNTALVAALALLTESFGRDVWWLRRHRTDRSPGRAAAALTIVALLLVWVAVVAPSRPILVTPSAFARLPVELLVVVAVAVLVPAAPRRVLAVVAGTVLGVLVVVKLLDLGFWTVFDRRFDPVSDSSYVGIGVETLRDGIGHSSGDIAVAVIGVLILGLLSLPALALLRITRVAAGHRGWALRAAAALGVVWVALRIVGAPAASTSAATLVVDEVRAVQAGLRAHKIIAREILRDRYRATPGDRLLTGLRGKDVLLLFVESYGKVAVQGSSFSPGVDAVLDRGTAQLRAAGFSSHTAFLKSTTFGGLSWLAHSTVQSGIPIESQRGYDQLVKSRRLTLTTAFERAGWRSIAVAPANKRNWSEGSTFYHYDKVYDRRNLGYHGPGFGLPPMPDQFVMESLQRQELAKRHRRPVFAEVDLISSHEPWTRIPRLIPWAKLGDGSIFNRVPLEESTTAHLFGDSARARKAYGLSIQYTMSTIVSFMRRYGSDKTVIVLLGDHQPATTVSGEGASHDVPISIIARDPKVMRQTAGWGWQDGLHPSPHAPVWPMSAFRDRFLSAFGSRPRPR
jgi:hypothetical protein